MKALALGFVAIFFFSVHTTATAAPECVKVTTSAIYSAYAYRHVVTLNNQCGLPQTCHVSTDVDPKPVHKVSLKKDETKSVITRTNSPARTFRANVSCEGAS